MMERLCFPLFRLISFSAKLTNRRFVTSWIRSAVLFEICKAAFPATILSSTAFLWDKFFFTVCTDCHFRSCLIDLAQNKRLEMTRHVTFGSDPIQPVAKPFGLYPIHKTNPSIYLCPFQDVPCCDKQRITLDHW